MKMQSFDNPVAGASTVLHAAVKEVVLSISDAVWRLA